jgi:hypothetical protein
LQKFLWRVPWDAHGEAATSGNAGSLHIFAEAGLNRIGVPTRTIQQVLHPEKPAAEKGFYIHPELFGAGTGTTDFVPLWTNNTGALGNSVLF